MFSRNALFGHALALAALAADQASKAWMGALYEISPPPLEIAPFLRLVRVWNTGISFGMLAGGGGAALLSAAIGVIALGVWVWLWRAPDRWSALALGAALGGAIGNLADRFRFGAVFDFLDFHLYGYHWPAFNIADSAIVCGVAALAWRSFRRPPDCAAAEVTPPRR